MNKIDMVSELICLVGKGRKQVITLTGSSIITILCCVPRNTVHH